MREGAIINKLLQTKKLVFMLRQLIDLKKTAITLKYFVCKL